MKPCDICEQIKEDHPDYNHCPVCGKFIGKNVYNREQDSYIKCDTDDPDKRKEESHPAYAQLAFSRRSTNKGHKNTLYGSSARHGSTISMRVYRSRKVYDKYSEHYFADRLPLIEVEMSQTQFSEAITAMNVGDGVPVTLRQFAGESMPMCPEWTLRERIDNDLKATFRSLTDRLLKYESRLQDILSKKGTVKVAEKKEIFGMYSSVIQEIRSNIPFMKECMDEAIDKSTNQAKGEIEAFWLNKMTQLGIEKLHELQDAGDTVKLIGDE